MLRMCSCVVTPKHHAYACRYEGMLAVVSAGESYSVIASRLQPGSEGKTTMKSGFDLVATSNYVLHLLSMYTVFSIERL